VPSGTRCRRCGHDSGELRDDSEIVAVVVEAMLAADNATEDGCQFAWIEVVRTRLSGELALAQLSAWQAEAMRAHLGPGRFADAIDAAER
jgi:hypothetical protein